MEATIPGRTAWETARYLKDHGHRAAVIAAHRAFSDFLEADEDSPAPPGSDIIVAAARSAEAVDAWAARHHVEARSNGRVYKAEVSFGPELKFAVIYVPVDVLDGELDAPQDAREDEPAPALAVTGAAA